ncbi:MAG: hypothetical protein ACRC1M_07485 [Methanobacteriaceae archaeon]
MKLSEIISNGKNTTTEFKESISTQSYGTIPILSNDIVKTGFFKKVGSTKGRKYILSDWDFF